MHGEITNNKCVDDVPKYKKKKDSDKSKSKSKSKHKHEYIECLFVEAREESERYYVGKYCKRCGKIGDFQWPMVRIEVDGCFLYRHMRNEEILKEYSYLEKIHIDNICQKFIPVSLQ